MTVTLSWWGNSACRVEDKHDEDNGSKAMSLWRRTGAGGVLAESMTIWQFFFLKKGRAWCHKWTVMMHMKMRNQTKTAFNRFKREHAEDHTE